LQQLTNEGRARIDELARRYAVGSDAVMTLLQALINGNGTMAQFNHPELGGGGQWMRGGMTMVGDMFNYGLKSKVDGLCSDLSQLLAEQPFLPVPASFQAQSQGSGQQQSGYPAAGPVSLFVPEAPGRTSSQWWPGELGIPNGSGAQNQVRYAYFNAAHQLAVEMNGQVTVYDSLDHQIGGVSQQQGSGASLTFTSQYGTVSVSSLPIVSVDGVPSTAPESPSERAALAPAPSTHAPAWQPEVQRAESAPDADVFAKIERLADLHKKGILSQEEFTSKKAELLSRL
jgi:hypothetical protein